MVGCLDCSSVTLGSVCCVDAITAVLTDLGASSKSDQMALPLFFVDNQGKLTVCEIDV